MSYLTRETFLKKVDESGSKYWQEGKNYRWQYMSYVIDILKEICPDDNKLIEAGTSGMPLSDKSFLYEYPEYNLDITPFKINGERIKNYKYRSFVALQVFEHLQFQEKTFQEIMRISESAILSFPYKWNWGDEMHKNITGEKISKWTCNITPVNIKIINHRAIYYWEFK